MASRCFIKLPGQDWKTRRGHPIFLHFLLVYPEILDRTSSTAQGGGGSFKTRKTIGEIGCCESRMSKQKH